jgi:hypothetical protein
MASPIETPLLETRPAVRVTSQSGSPSRSAPRGSASTRLVSDTSPMIEPLSNARRDELWKGADDREQKIRERSAYSRPNPGGSFTVSPSGRPTRGALAAEEERRLPQRPNWLVGKLSKDEVEVRSTFFLQASLLQPTPPCNLLRPATYSALQPTPPLPSTVLELSPVLSNCALLVVGGGLTIATSGRSFVCSAWAAAVCLGGGVREEGGS